MTVAGNHGATAPLILVTRPAEDAGPLMAALSARGYAPLPAPLLTMVWRDGGAVELTGVAAIVFTSANGVRALTRRNAVADGRTGRLPVYAVGDATARAARGAGFTDVISADGDIHALAAVIRHRCRPGDGMLLHVAGSEVAGDLAALLAGDGFSLRREVLYDAVAADRLPEPAVRGLNCGTVAGVVFFSPRTARSFVNLAAAAGVANGCRQATAYCLSPAVAAAAASLPWRAVKIAPLPQQDSLLALLPPAGRQSEQDQEA